MKLNHSKWRCTSVVQQIQQTRVSQTISGSCNCLIFTGHSKEQLAITVNRYYMYLVKRSCINLDMFADYVLFKGDHTRPRKGTHKISRNFRITLHISNSNSVCVIHHIITTCTLGPVYISSRLTRNLPLGYFRTNVNISNCVNLE